MAYNICFFVTLKHVNYCNSYDFTVDAENEQDAVDKAYDKLPCGENKEMFIVNSIDSPEFAF